MHPFPKHIAIIMDGNGRWAQEHGWPRIQGHRRGARNVRELTRFCAEETPLEILTLYAFSHENWARPSREVELLMKLLKIFAIRERPLLKKHNVRLSVIGDLQRLPSFAREALQETMDMTKHHSKMVLQLALSYGGRDEIIRAIKRAVKERESDVEAIDEATFASYLDTAGQPDPDLIIRTSGEQRTSNFLLWQSAYAEYYFTPTAWPDFSSQELMEAVESYRHRERRFGGAAFHKALAK